LLANPSQFFYLSNKVSPYSAYVFPFCPYSTILLPINQQVETRAVYESLIEMFIGQALR